MIAIITALGMGGLGGVIREWWRDRRRDPIDRATAMVALSQTAGEQALALVHDLREEVTRLHAREASTQAALAGLRRDFDTFRKSWLDWYRHITRDWSRIRQQPIPPDPPLVDGDSYSSIIE